MSWTEIRDPRSSETLPVSHPLLSYRTVQYACMSCASCRKHGQQFTDLRAGKVQEHTYGQEGRRHVEKFHRYAGIRYIHTASNSTAEQKPRVQPRPSNLLLRLHLSLPIHPFVQQRNPSGMEVHLPLLPSRADAPLWLWLLCGASNLSRSISPFPASSELALAAPQISRSGSSALTGTYGASQPTRTPPHSLLLGASSVGTMISLISPAASLM